jgi:hypothetical protein
MLGGRIGDMMLQATRREVKERREKKVEGKRTKKGIPGWTYVQACVIKP